MIIKTKKKTQKEKREICGELFRSHNFEEEYESEFLQDIFSNSPYASFLPMPPIKFRKTVSPDTNHASGDMQGYFLNGIGWKGISFNSAITDKTIETYYEKRIQKFFREYWSHNIRPKNSPCAKCGNIYSDAHHSNISFDSIYKECRLLVRDNDRSLYFKPLEEESFVLPEDHQAVKMFKAKHEKVVYKNLCKKCHILEHHPKVVDTTEIDTSEFSEDILQIEPLNLTKESLMSEQTNKDFLEGIMKEALHDILVLHCRVAISDKLKSYSSDYISRRATELLNELFGAPSESPATPKAPAKAEAKAKPEPKPEPVKTPPKASAETSIQDVLDSIDL